MATTPVAYLILFSRNVMGVSTTKCEIVCIRLSGMCDVFFLARESPFLVRETSDFDLVCIRFFGTGNIFSLILRLVITPPCTVPSTSAQIPHV